MARRAIARWRLRLVALFCLALVAVQAVAETSQPKLEALQKQIRQLKQQHQQTERRLSNAESELRKFDQDIADTHTKLQSVKQDIQDKRQQIEGLQKELGVLLTRLGESEHSLEEQLQAIYQMGRQPYVKMLLNDSDPARMGRLFVYYRYFTSAYLENIEQLQQRADALASLQQQMTDQKANLEELLKRREQDLAYLTTRRDQRQSRFNELKSQNESELRNLRDLLDDQERLGQLSREIATIPPEISDPPVDAGTRFAKSRGRLSWPVSGKILADFGNRRQSSGQLKWRGVLLGAKLGEPVKAVASGRVVFADWLRGFGYMLIVDHGDGYMTLYGHNEALLKAEGASVKAGDQIALAGTSGREEDVAVYFEVRHRGEPVNPRQWMLAKRQ